MKSFKASIDGVEVMLEGYDCHDALARAGYVAGTKVFSSGYYVGVLENGKRYRIARHDKSDRQKFVCYEPERLLSSTELHEMNLKRSRGKRRLDQACEH